MYKTILNLSLFLLSISSAWAQTGAPVPPTETVISPELNNLVTTYAGRMVQRFNTQVPLEKIYIQTDKPYYLAGEQVWYKLYLLNATTHEPSVVSKMVYVELVDERDTVRLRQMLMPVDSGFYGSFLVPATFSDGNYRLRAYTSWMRNAGEEYLYSKPIPISNNALNSIFSHVTYQRKADGKIRVTMLFLNRQQKPYSQLKVEYALRQEDNDQRVRTSVTNAQGKIVFDIKPKASKGFKPYIEIRTSGLYGAYVKRHFTPSFMEDVDVQFFPESGSLVNGIPSVVAFKAINQDGFGTDISGVVLNQKGDTVSQFQSAHLGMGKLVLQPQVGDLYTAHIVFDGGTKKIPLPTALKEGAVMTIRNKKDAYMISVVNNLQQTGVKPAFILGHTRGMVNFVRLVNQQKQAYVTQVSKSEFPSGIVSFSLFDTKGNVLAERLIFHRGADTASCTLTADKKTYLSREKVRLELDVKDQAGVPIKGNFSLSVTDSKDILSDPTSQNIMSYLLMSSDIKGNVEKPGLYFNGTLENASDKLDLLMMTQAWRRFDISKVVSGRDTAKMEYPVELGPEITGTVRNIFEMKSKNAVMVMLAPSINYFMTTVTDAKGKFTFKGYKCPDSTVYVISAKGAKGSKLVDPYLDEVIYPRFRYSEATLFDPPKVSKDYIQTATEKLFYQGGDQVINLEEIVVTGNANAGESTTTFGADFSIGSQELENYSGASLISLIASLPGVSRITFGSITDDSEESADTQTKLSFRGNSNPPLFLVDNMEVTMEDVMQLNSSDIQTVDVVKNAAGTSMYGVRGAGGVVAITLKRGTLTNYKRQPPGIVLVKPLGAHQPKQFYSPNYAVADSIMKVTPDLRNTLHWEPMVKTDRNGKAVIEFYTADRVNDYRITVEGVGENGRLGRIEGYIKRE